MRRIMLTSKGFVNHAIQSAFLDTFCVSPAQQKVAIIPTAAVKLKGKHPHTITAIEQLSEMGFSQVDVIDVEEDDVLQLHQYDVIYIGGGNPFYLLEQLRQSGADAIITSKANNGAIIVGVSAGVLVLGLHIEIAQYFTPEMRSITKMEDTSALGLLPFLIMPHCDREDVFPGEVSIEKRLQTFEKQYNVSVVRLKDDEALLLKEGNMIRI